MRDYLLKRQVLGKFLSEITLIRGRDGIGITVYDITKQRFKSLYINSATIVKFPKNKLFDVILNFIQNNINECGYVLIQSRAIPETEPQKMLQPIRYKNIILIHNGLIYNDKQILQNSEDKLDSLALAHYIQKNGLSEKIFTVVKGSYVSLFVDTNKKTLNYVVNYMPLYKYTINDDLNIYTNIEPSCIQKHEYLTCVEDIRPYSFGILEDYDEYKIS
jgi:glutamine phosphoribosylpyrophosphate amidotransferase